MYDQDRVVCLDVQLSSSFYPFYSGLFSTFVGITKILTVDECSSDFYVYENKCKNLVILGRNTIL